MMISNFVKDISVSFLLCFFYVLSVALNYKSLHILNYKKNIKKYLTFLNL